MIYTGITALDEMIGGGVPRGKRVLFSLAPGVEGQQFMFSALKCAHRMGKRCLVVVPHTSAEAFLADLSATPYGMEADDRLIFLDSLSFEEIEANSRTPEAECAAWKEQIDTICRNGPINAIFLYCNRLCDEIGTEHALALFFGRSLKGGATLFVEYLNLYDEEHLDDLTASCLFDLVLSIGEGYGNILFFNHFMVRHVTWTSLPPRQIPYMIREDGSVAPQIPKIVVTGPTDAGKTTFIQTVSENWVSSDRIGISGSATTVAMDFGHPLVSCRGFEITLVGTPGQEHFGPIITHLLTNATGVIFVVDGTRAESLSRGLDILGMVRRMRIPFVVAVNKRELPGQISDATLRTLLRLSERIPLHHISALNREEAMGVIDALIMLITRETFLE
ncbi:GTP-binding protein [Methanofollis tationis]|uniref:GTP-binding protein n=1 Tax=Methanofollis tationis TaxID=81417 RepID=A0A7K4HL69_9EURY|nr:GTP-binding protein [Methanofollis tationis]NVO65939.1 GTP-binding protein [Methanofollis tationis]